MNAALNQHPEDRLQAIKTRRLEIDATLAEWKRAYFVDGVERPFQDRLTLEAEAAQLALERRVIETDVLNAKLARREQDRLTHYNQLIAVLTERGMEYVIAEAQARTDSGLQAIAILTKAAASGAALDGESLEQGDPS